MDNLSKRATLVNLTIRSWSARCVDKKISDQILYENAAKADAGKFNKRLLEKDTLKEITSILNDVRKYYKDRTLAWKDGDTRLLPVKFVTEFMDKMREFETSLDYAVKEFVSQYPEFKEKAKEMLNGMYNDDDYPDIGEIAEKFKIEHSFNNISDPNDFRCEVSEDVKEQIKSSMQSDIEQQYTYSMKKLYERIFTVIKKFNETLSKEDAVFHKSLIGNVEELVSLLPDLNFMNDSKINNLTEQIQNEICRFDPEALRKDKTQREEAVKASNDILNAMESFYA